MPKRWMPKSFSSIFVKLMVVIVIIGLGINLAIIFFFGAIRYHLADTYHSHLNRYVDYLLEDIGDPPNQARARRIAAETHMIITYDGQDRSWTTATAPLQIPAGRLRIRHKDDRMQAGSYRGTYVVHVKQGDGRFTFYIPHEMDAEKKIKVLGMGLLLFITALMTVAYFVIRWVLRPLRWLKHGVEQVAQGELSHRVPIRRSDELRDLSASFNTMTERLQQLIQSKEQLLLDVSHELRTPLTRIKVALAMMPDSPDRHSIEDDLKEMETKIAELLETARAINIKASLNYAPTDLGELIRNTAQRFDSGRPAIRIAPLPEMESIPLDGELMRKALKNILDNAQKYTPDDRPPIEISVAVDAAEVVLSIQDYGMGISPQDLVFVFEPFYRVDKARTPQRDGYGLGLSMAKNIIEAHGGRIVMQSQLDHGTCVKVHLPRVRDASG